MFTDVSVSEGLNVKYSDYLIENEMSLGVSFHMFVLQVCFFFISMLDNTHTNIPESLNPNNITFEKNKGMQRLCQKISVYPILFHFTFYIYKIVKVFDWQEFFCSNFAYI